MVISARVHYACLAMLELAMRLEDPAPVTIREIADRHGVPGPFLVQILRALKTAGWVQSVRGSQGGYRLTADPTRITVLEIAMAVGCQESGCQTGGRGSAVESALQDIWDQAGDASRQVLSQARLSDLIEQCRHGDESMFYI